MIEYDDDMTPEEVHEEALQKVEFANERLEEAEANINSEGRSQRDAQTSIEDARALAQDLESVLSNAESALEDAIYDGDSGIDGIQEARGVLGTLPEFVEALSEAEGSPTAETDVTIGGTRYRIRFDPMEEAETGAPIHHRDPNDE